MTDVQHARDIHARALSQVVTRIAEAERQFPPSVVPIVAANIAMAAMLDQLVDEPVGTRLHTMYQLAEVCDGPTSTSRAGYPCTCLETRGEFCDMHGTDVGVAS